MPLRPRTLLCIAPVFAALACSSVSLTAQNLNGDTPDTIEIRQYRLTMEKVEQFVAATVALGKLKDSDPALKKQMDSASSGNETITQEAADLEQRFPQVAALVRSHGLAPREYIVVFMALLYDVSLVGMKRQGAIQDYPPNTITPENAAFIEQNYDKLTQALSPLKTQSGDQK